MSLAGEFLLLALTAVPLVWGYGPLEIIASNENEMKIGSRVTIYCSILNSSAGSEKMEWYKKRFSQNATEFLITSGRKIKLPFSKTSRYDVRFLDMEYEPSALTISDIKKEDEGIIGCRYGKDRAETTVRVSGGIDDVFIDVKHHGRREKTYKKPGTLVHFERDPLETSSIKCHVQATTDEIEVVMKINGETTQTVDEGTVVDPVTDDPLQERMYTKYARIDRFIPRGEFNQGSIDCIAYSPNYPDIIVTNNITLDVEHKPSGICSVFYPPYCQSAINITCTISYNPIVILASWTQQSTGRTMNAYSDASDGIKTFHQVYSSYETEFTIALECGVELPDNEVMELEVQNWLGHKNIAIKLKKPLPPPTVDLNETVRGVEAQRPLFPGRVDDTGSGDSDDEADESDEDDAIGAANQDVQPKIAVVGSAASRNRAPDSESRVTYLCLIPTLLMAKIWYIV